MNTFRALADDTPREIVNLLAYKGELLVNEISKNFNMTSPTVSQHLKVLKTGNLIQMKKEAQKRMYSIDESGLSEIENWLLDIRKIWNKRLGSLNEYLKTL
ncbi:MAG: winged helix-turn-helix transcriptional regulator [Leptospiraceae bacterium]|nr:winged helix-turn-helix transcriptional regulator [Leptospiraceae bacterium]